MSTMPSHVSAMATPEALQRHYRHASFFIKEIKSADVVQAEIATQFHAATIAFKVHVPGMTEIQAARVPELAQLQQQRDSIHFSRRELELKLNNHLIPLAFTSCREICDLVSTMLPRELRDMIYGHLITVDPSNRCSDVTVVANDSCGYYPSRFVPSNVRGSGWPNPPHFWQSDWAGKEFVRELVEIWYKSVSFNFNCQPHLIQPFLNNKSWKGVVPAKLIRHVRLTIQVDHFEESRDRQYEKTLKTAALFRNLRKLANLRHGTRVDVNIAAQDFKVQFIRGIDSETLRRVLNELRPIFCELISSGKALTILVGNKEFFTPTSPDLSTETWVGLLHRYEIVRGAREDERRRQGRARCRRQLRALKNAHKAKVIRESVRTSGTQTPGPLPSSSKDTGI